MRCAHRAVYRGEELLCAVRARGDDVEDFRGRAVLLRAARAVAGGGRWPGGQRLCQGRAAATADGIRGRGPEADLDQPRRLGRITPHSLGVTRLRRSSGCDKTENIMSLL